MGKVLTTACGRKTKSTIYYWEVNNQGIVLPFSHDTSISRSHLT